MKVYSNPVSVMPKQPLKRTVTPQVNYSQSQPKAAAPRFGFLDPITGGLALLGLGVAYVLGSTKVVKQSEIGAVEQFGEYKKKVGPGLQFVPLGLRSIRKVDTKRQRIDLPEVTYMTKDKATVAVDGVVYVKVTNPEKALYEVENYNLAILDAAQGTLRQMIAEMDFDDALQSRDEIKAKLTERFNESEQEWGVKVMDIELKKLDPNDDLQKALDAQKIAAQRKIAMETEALAQKNAQVTKSLGDKEAKIQNAQADKESAIQRAEAEKERVRLESEAAVLRAEAEKQSAILKAEAEQKALILEAEADRQAAIARAQGQEQSIRMVETARAEMARRLIEEMNAGKPTDQTVQLHVVQQLPEFVKGSNVVVVPADTGSFLGSALGVLKGLNAAEAKSGGAAPAAEPKTETPKTEEPAK